MRESDDARALEMLRDLCEGRFGWSIEHIWNIGTTPEGYYVHVDGFYSGRKDRFRKRGEGATIAAAVQDVVRALTLDSTPYDTAVLVLLSEAKLSEDKAVESLREFCGEGSSWKIEQTSSGTYQCEIHYAWGAVGDQPINSGGFQSVPQAIQRAIQKVYEAHPDR